MNPLPILRDSWYFFARHMGAIAVLCLPLLVLESLTRYLLVGTLTADPSPAYELVTSLLFYPLYTGALILFVDTRSRGLTVRYRDLLAMALQLWPRFAVLSALSTVLIMAGASLFILPGLWVMIKIAFAEYLLVLDRLTPLAAMRESFRLTQGHFVTISACVLTVMLPLWLLDARSFPELKAWGDIPVLILDCLRGFLQLFASVVVFRLFMLATPERAAEP
ncbi:hypothetical protein NVV93_03150 [Pseudomonas sp. LS44]|uniref:YciC family protein n=1 Tax=Pseudomonas sp. LS44 TaxID=1357074 RepID=UPI00215A2C83|nr:YciC family protein [Pseudomonas sp. LS44]UVE18417.1 hypothetical protein NVV93_03150 [Pseudomonas sp. LS44]